MLTFICYIRVYFAFAFLDCVCHNEDYFKIIEVCYTKILFYIFFVTLPELKKIILYSKELII